MDGRLQSEDVGRAIDARRAELAAAITDRHYAIHPELAERYGARGREKCEQDAAYHLAYLSEALANDLPSLFADYAVWARSMLAGRGIPAEDLVENLRVLGDALGAELRGDSGATVRAYVDAAIDAVAGAPPVPPSYIEPDQPLADLALAYVDALVGGDRREASRLVLEAVEDGASLRDIYTHVFERSQHEIGRLWQLNRLSVAQEHYCTAATQLVMSQLYPHVFGGERNGRTLVATCVSENLHEIGLRMVSDFLEMEGWDTYYLGANAPIDTVVRAVAERHADVLAISATLTYHVRTVAATIAAVRASEACAGTKILVGGYPFNAAPGLWERVGADAHARDAAGAVEAADRLVREGARG